MQTKQIADEIFALFTKVVRSPAPQRTSQDFLDWAVENRNGSLFQLLASKYNLSDQEKYLAELYLSPTTEVSKWKKIEDLQPLLERLTALNGLEDSKRAQLFSTLEQASPLFKTACDRTKTLFLTPSFRQAFPRTFTVAFKCLPSPQITRGQAKTILKRLPVGACFVYKEGDACFCGVRMAQGQAMDTYISFIQRCDPAKFFLLKAKDSHTYDNDLYFNLGGGTTLQYLTKKYQQRQIPLNAVDFKVKKNEQTIESELAAQLKKLTHSSRLYVQGHGRPGCESIYSIKKQDRLPFDQLARLLDENAPQLKKIKPGERPIRISFVVCNGATFKNHHVGYAQRFSRALNFPAEIVARTGVVSMHKEGHWLASVYSKRVDNTYHELGSKISILRTSDGQLIQSVVIY